MGCKQMDRNMTFAEFDLMTSMVHNRSLKMMAIHINNKFRIKLWTKLWKVVCANQC